MTINQLVINTLLNHGPISMIGISNLTGVPYQQVRNCIQRLINRVGLDIRLAELRANPDSGCVVKFFSLDMSEKVRSALDGKYVRTIKRGDSYDYRLSTRIVLDHEPFVPSDMLPPLAWVAAQITRSEHAVRVD